jgi:hypothetical protein
MHAVQKAFVEFTRGVQRVGRTTLALIDRYNDIGQELKLCILIVRNQCSVRTKTMSI